MAGSGFEVSTDQITALQKNWSAHEGQITPMAGRLSSMIGEITDAANAAMKGKSQSDQATIRSLAQEAQQAVNEAMSAVRTLSSELSQDAAKLGQTADTYRLAELAAKDHITSAAQLASYNGPDAGQIRSLLRGQNRQQAWNTDQQAVGIAFPGSGSAASASGSGPGGAGEGPGGGAAGDEGGSAYAGAGTGSGAGAGGGGYAGATGGGGGVSAGGGGSYGGTGTPVAPNAAASSPQVDQWVQQAIKELEKEGVPASKIDPNAIKLIIEHESGGNPNIVNNWDSNAAAGHPSEGLMQTIAPTFQQYSSPGHGNILNPVDNIMAGCKYALARYGSLDNVPGVVAVEHGGSYVGY